MRNISPGARVWRPDPQDEYLFREGCYILELSNHPGDPEVSIARARVIPGVTTRLHRLKDTHERYHILQGFARVELGGNQPQTVTAGDVVYIPPMMSQRITNTGAQDLVFLAICSPRFVPENYQSLSADSGTDLS